MRTGPNRSDEIARAKRALDEKYGEQPSAPFLGWHSRGYLPHCDKPGLIQFVTFRLDDAMPAERRREWEPLLTIEDERERHTKLEAYLDRGYGQCHLRGPEAALLVEQTLLFWDAQPYRLCAWVVMPNHVHVLFEVWTVPLGEAVRSWKKFTALRINRLLGRAGRLWQEDYWDRYMRDEAHFNRARRYVESNPVKAGLCAAAADWPWNSANPKWGWEGARNSVARGSNKAKPPEGTEPRTTELCAPSRYRGGHLASENWARFLAQARP